MPPRLRLRLRPRLRRLRGSDREVCPAWGGARRAPVFSDFSGKDPHTSASVACCVGRMAGSRASWWRRSPPFHIFLALVFLGAPCFPPRMREARRWLHVQRSDHVQGHT